MSPKMKTKTNSENKNQVHLFRNVFFALWQDNLLFTFEIIHINTHIYFIYIHMYTCSSWLFFVLNIKPRCYIYAIETVPLS